MPKTKRIRKNHWVLVIACTAGAGTIGAAIAPATSAPRGLTSQGERGTVKRTKTKVDVSLTWRADRHGGGEAFRGTVSVPTGLKAARQPRCAASTSRTRWRPRTSRGGCSTRSRTTPRSAGSRGSKSSQSIFYAITELCKGSPGSNAPAEDAIAAVRSGELRADLGTP
jgi:hypothetical protein